MAPGVTAPVASWTKPEMVALSDCAKALRPRPRLRARAPTRHERPRESSRCPHGLTPLERGAGPDESQTRTKLMTAAPARVVAVHPSSLTLINDSCLNDNPVIDQVCLSSQRRQLRRPWKAGHVRDSAPSATWDYPNGFTNCQAGAVFCTRLRGRIFGRPRLAPRRPLGYDGRSVSPEAPGHIDYDASAHRSNIPGPDRHSRGDRDGARRGRAPASTGSRPAPAHPRRGPARRPRAARGVPDTSRSSPTSRPWTAATSRPR